MSVMFGYIASEPDRIACALHGARAALRVDLGTHPDGWGLGFYQGGEVLLQKRPRVPPGVVDFYEQLKGLRTDLAIGHVRSATVGKTQKTENTHPYRFRSWLFAHSGTLAGFDKIQPELVEHIPDFLRRNIRGQTDSEHIFHLFLAFLHDAGRLDDPDLTPDVARSVMRGTVAFLDRLSGAASAGAGERRSDASELSLMATNGRLLIATRGERPMSLLRVQGIQDCPVCRGPMGRESRRVAHEHLRAILLLSDGEPPTGPGWEPLPKRSIITITHDISAQISGLRD